MERVLKLGLTQIAKEYQCVRPSYILPIQLSEMPSVQPALSPPRVLVCSKRNGGRPTTQSFVLVDSISPFRPYHTFLPIHRTVSTIYGVPVPQNSRGRHPAA